MEGGYSELLMPSAGLISILGDPELPAHTEFVLLARDGTPYLEWEISVAETIFALPPHPSQHPPFENGEPGGAPVPPSRVYQSGAVYPPEFASIQVVGTARGIPLGKLTIFPARYDFSIGAFIVARRARLSVNLGGSIAPPPERLRSRPFMEMLSSITFNGHAMPTPLSEDPGEYLVICPDNCWDALGEFVSHKESRGHKVVSVRLSEIASPPTTTTVKAFIQEQYETLNPAPTFVVLIGDVDMDDGTRVPHHGFSTYHSDHGYSLLDGDDFFSDVLIGRMSVNNASEFRVMTEKIRRYENEPLAGGADWMQKAIVVATYDHAITPVWNVLWVREMLLAHGFTQIDSFFQRGSSIPPASTISEKINAGLSYVDYRGWAGSNGWWEPPYDRFDVLALTNSNAYPVVTSIVCGTGDFGSTWTDPCFGEAWIRAGSVTNPRGGVAFYGTSDHHSRTRYNNPINSGFYTAVFDHYLPHIGQCMWVSKAECQRLHPFDIEELEKYFATYNLLGDPGLMMYHGWTPEVEVEHTPIELGANVLAQVSSGGVPLSGALVCLYRPNTGERSLAYTNFAGEAELFVPGSGAGTVRMTAVAPFHITFTEDFTVSGAPNISIVSTRFNDSSGDGDGRIDPGESGVLEVTIRNNGALVRHLECYLWCEHEGFTITAGFDSLSRMWGGEQRTLEFEISANGFASGGGPAKFDLLCDTREGAVLLPFELQLEPSSFRLDTILIDGGHLLPGETSTARLVVRHTGSLDPPPMTFRVYSTSGWLDVLSDSVEVVIDGGVGTSAPFGISASASAFKGTVVELDIFRQTPDGSARFAKFPLALGERTSTDPSGPDGWGYFAYDDTDIASGFAPTSAFEDISLTGDFYTVGDDDKFEVLLPLNFVFYGQAFDTLTICTNGWAAPGVQPYFMLDFYNTPIPAPNGPWGTLAPFWDDLDPILGPGGIYCQHFPAEGKFIVQWERMRHASIDGMDNTFQIAIFDADMHPTRTGDSPIEFRYKGAIENVDYLEEFATVGIECPNHFHGIEYMFGLREDPGAAFLTDNRVIRFSTDCGSALVRGRVSLERGHPCGAEITSAGGHRTEPDTSGLYRWTEVVPGTHIFTCTAPGHFAQVETITAFADEAVELDFNLRLAPIPDFSHISKAEGEDYITLIWSPPAGDVEPTGYRIQKYLSLGAPPEVIETSDTAFIDADVHPARKYWYSLAAVYEACASLPSAPDSGWVELFTTIEEADLPREFAIYAYPNPFNSSVTIAIDGVGAIHELPLRVEIYDLAGRRIDVISRSDSDEKSRTIQGDFSPSGRNDSEAEFIWQPDETLPSGVYLVRARWGSAQRPDGGQTAMKRVVYLK